MATLAEIEAAFQTVLRIMATLNANQQQAAAPFAPFAPVAPVAVAAAPVAVAAAPVDVAAAPVAAAAPVPVAAAVAVAAAPVAMAVRRYQRVHPNRRGFASDDFIRMWIDEVIRNGDELWKNGIKAIVQSHTHTGGTVTPVIVSFPEGGWPGCSVSSLSAFATKVAHFKARNNAVKPANGGNGWDVVRYGAEDGPRMSALRAEWRSANV